MSVIRDQEKLNSRQLETLRRRNDREMKKIDSMHQDYRAEVHKTNRGEILNLREEHERQVVLDNEKKEKVLAELKDNLDKTRDMTDKELLGLKQKSTKIRIDDKKRLAEDREAMVAEHEFFIEDINERFNDAAQKVHYDGKSRIEDRTSSLQDEFAQNEAQFKTKQQQQMNAYTSRIKEEGTSFEQIKNDQESKFKKERIQSVQKQNSDLSKTTEVHNHHVKNRDTNFSKDIKNQDLAFEKKYQEHLKIHTDNLGRLDEQNQKAMTSIKSEGTQKLAATEKRSDDPFYNFNDLAPTLTHHPEHIEVKVKVADHSKKDLQLTTNNKEVILNFNRRHDDTHSPQKGVVNKLHKVETYTTRMTADFILNPKTVKSSYQDGVMTYTIGRA